MRCSLPGCKNETADGACPECREAFGDRLRPATTPAPRMTAEQLDARDNEVLAIHASRRRKLAHPEPGERRSNQLCWMCEQRRACTLMLGRWECSECRAVSG